VESKAPSKAVVGKYGVLACVNKLAIIGYNLPTYSSLKIQFIDGGSYHDLKGFCARLAQHNQNDVVSLVQHWQYLDLLLLESLVLISIFLPTLNYRLSCMT
jgi:hypothetical protein